MRKRMGKRLAKKEIVERAKKVHENKYDYSEFLKEDFEYKNSSQKMPIICHEKYENGKEHGIFYSDFPHHVKRGQGCPICSNRKYDIDKFKQLAKIRYKDKYIYDENTKYSSDTSNKVIVTCREHGQFLVTPGNHLNGQGCPLCSKPRLVQDDEIKRFKEIHGNDYSYEKTIIRGAKDAIIVTCSKHGDFKTTPNSHKNGYRCPKCSLECLGSASRLSWDEFVEKSTKVFRGYYKYKPQEYKNNKTHVIATCPKHGDFEIRPDHHLMGRGCPKCNESKLERELRLFLEEKQIEYEYRKKSFSWLNGMELDFYLPKYNVAIECQGGQHFNLINFFNKRELFIHRQELDSLKRRLCEENGIKLLYYSNLGIEYPYEVFEDREKLLNEILSKNYESVN